MEFNIYFYYFNWIILIRNLIQFILIFSLFSKFKNFIVENIKKNKNYLVENKIPKINKKNNDFILIHLLTLIFSFYFLIYNQTIIAFCFLMYNVYTYYLIKEDLKKIFIFLKEIK